MADNKKYYYLKLKDNFYDSEQMIILQNMQDGYLYSDILMKLYLRSLKTDGKLIFNNIIPYTPEVLAQVVRHQVGTVKQALQIFKQLGLIEILDNGTIFMLDIQNFIGKSSTEADRIRQYRNEISEEKILECTNVQQMDNKDTPEIEIKIDIEIEKDIVDYLNLKTNKHFKYTANNLNKIRARLKEGFTLEDFKQVIDKKCLEWLNDPKMNTYLRPETLFGSKFESYLQQESKTTTPNWVGKTYEQTKANPEEEQKIKDLLSEFE